VTHLRDASLEDLDACKGQISEVVFRRARHVISENTRCLKFADALGKSHLEIAGKLMVESHNSLKNDYEVSCAELDFLVEKLMQDKDVIGARMTGGGFGGSVIALVKDNRVPKLISWLCREYRSQFNMDATCFVTRACGGAHSIH